MKRKIMSLFFICVCIFVYCKDKEEIIQPEELKKIIEQHSLVEKAEIYKATYAWTLKSFYYKETGKELELPYTFDLDLTLTNGHTVSFVDIPNDLVFYKRGGIFCINNVRFCSVGSKSKGNRLYLRDLSKATNTNYYDLFTILDNYNDFCKLLNSLPYDTQEVCAKYSDSYYVYLYRRNNSFIEIPEE